MGRMVGRALGTGKDFTTGETGTRQEKEAG